MELGTLAGVLVLVVDHDDLHSSVRLSFSISFLVKMSLFLQFFFFFQLNCTSGARGAFCGFASA